MGSNILNDLDLEFTEVHFCPQLHMYIPSPHKESKFVCLSPELNTYFAVSAPSCIAIPESHERDLLIAWQMASQHSGDH